MDEKDSQMCSQDGLIIQPGELKPYILPERIQLRYTGNGKEYPIEFTMQAGGLRLDDGRLISIFRAVTPDEVNTKDFPPYIHRRISVFGLKVEG